MTAAIEAATVAVAIEVNAEKCERCPSSKYQDLVGQPYCEAKQPCAPGTYSDADGATACAKCPNGRYQSAPGQQRCEACEAGRAAELTAASPLNVQCDACDAGTELALDQGRATVVTLPFAIP